MSLQKQKPIVSKKIRASAKGQECLIRIPGVCNYDTSTTVLCHENGGGAGMKKDDIEAAYGCSSCHDVIDGRVKKNFTKDEIKLFHRDGSRRTRRKLYDMGLLEVAE